MTDHRRGLIITSVGVLCIVPDGSLVRAIDAGTLTTIMWRSALVGITASLWFVLRRGRTLPATIRAMGRPGIAVGILWGTGTMLFVAAVDNTSIGNAVLILASSPIWAALLDRFVLGRTIPRRTMVAIPLALVGVSIAFWASAGGGRLTGDLIALLASFLLAVNFTILRRYQDRDLSPAPPVAFLIAALLLYLAGVEIALEPGDLVPILVLGLLVVPSAMILITTGAQLLSPPETALLLLLETILSPLLGALVVDEAIPTATLIGGALVVATLGGHAVATLRAD
ncbi:MAG: DMT family transporter [Actinomycetia bacterium]|nr:DMT family transporter [Actinomycetes bacterium]MCP3911144.1 DMT family transporter [Actinomycetes bacterium]MCP4086920.1 DMT family transporter [Actinomycetes bacterium]